MRIEKMEKRNNLETMIYRKKEWIDSNEATIYSKPEELEKARNTLTEIYNWFDDEAFSADISTIKEKTDLLIKDFDEIDNRINKHKKREAFEDSFVKIINKTITESEKLIKEKPWIEEHYNNIFLKELENANKWFSEMKEKQNNMKLNEVIINNYRIQYSFLMLLKQN